MSNPHDPATSTTGKRRSRFRFSRAPNTAVFVHEQYQNYLSVGNSAGIPEEVLDSLVDDEPLSYQASSNYSADTNNEAGQYDNTEEHDAFDEEPVEEREHHGDDSEEESTQPEFASEAPVESGTSLKLENWCVLWGVLMVSGNDKLTKPQYQSMRMIADTFRRAQFTGTGFWKSHVMSDENRDAPNGNIMSLPHFSTLASTYRKEVLQSLTVRAIDADEIVDTSKAGARAKNYSVEGIPRVPVRTVLPSEYARADLATTKVYDLLTSTSLTAFSSEGGLVNCPAARVEDCVDIWPVVAAREYFYGPPQHISVDRDLGNGRTLVSPFAEVDDAISLSILGSKNFCDAFASAFAPAFSADGYSELKGDIMAIWPVHHISRKGMVGHEPLTCPGMSSRDQSILDMFQFTAYQSPSDDLTVSVPELPQDDRGVLYDGEEIGPELRARKKRRVSPATQNAHRERREAIRRRDRQIQQAWLNWKKPVIKPGDVACLLRPSSHSTTQNSDAVARVILFHRFWVENEERRRHVVWIPCDTDIRASLQGEANSDVRSTCHQFTDDQSDIIREVIACNLFSVHSGPRGISKYRPISSVGTLESGERYFIYRFMLYWDGFEVAKGKSASGDGFYLLCLNLPMNARSSANAVRIITLSPPGVKSLSVFKRVQEDIIQGMTDGFVDYDATGNKCRIFLDLVGFVGDTPALNASLDTLGHTATTFCHLCRYTKRTTDHIGSRYAMEGSNGHTTGMGRSFLIHTAIRDCNAQKHTCRLLGMKPTSANSELPLHALRIAMLEARARIRKTEHGLPILTGFLDPYLSCFIAPDHLLTAHLRDCINLAYRLLPTAHCRSLAETFMIAFLKDCKLKPHNRLFDRDTKTLFAMSMTDLYSLSIVAEFSFIQANLRLDSTPHPVIARKCTQAITLVGSISRLISALWRLPSADIDSPSVLSSFHVLNGARYVSRLQNNVFRHLSLVRSVCEMSPENTRAFEEESLPRTLRADLMRERAICSIATRVIDKPNVHRLVELVCSTLPMVGHVSRVGELVLEKAHQTLKRAVRQGNNKDIQLLALNSAIFKDWESRLSLQLKGALDGDPLSTLGCFRLLAGRKAVLNSKANLTASDVGHIRNVIGPPSCIPAFLQTGNRTVYCYRADPDFLLHLSWDLRGDVEAVESGGALSDPHRNRALSKFQRAQRLHSSAPPQLFANKLKISSKNGTSLLRLQIGDVVEVLCYRPKDIAFHTPFIITRQCLGNVSTDAEGPALWAISALFRTSSTQESNGFWAALRPCSRVPGAQAPTGFYHYNFPHFVRNTISFIKVGLYMRTVAVLHDCSPSLCCTSPHSRHVDHVPSSTLASGAIFFPITRAHGYPPRQG